MKADPARGQMKLGAFFHPGGHHVASWLHPEAQPDAGTNFRHYVQLAQMSEAAKFDLMFLADAVAVRDGKAEALSRWPQYMAYFEPLTLDDAFLRDRSTGRYHDPAKMHVLHHKGAHFSVRGPLNVARSPQGHPVIFQAGSSEVGKGLAARTAEAVFTAAYTLEGARAFYHDLKSRMARYGRAPDHLKVMPGLNVIPGRTEAEARDKYAYLQSLIHPSVGLKALSNALAGFDLEGYDLDGPLPDAVYGLVPKGSTSAFRNVIDWARDEKLTIRQLYQRYAGARGQRTLIGSATQIADSMQDWFINRGVDGFLIQPSHLPGGLLDFITLVIPELQNRGVFRTEYEGATLRENPGLPRPTSRYASEHT